MAEWRRFAGPKDLRLGRTVAIKRLRVDLASDPTFQARFRREAQSAASLNHPTIVAVYDTGEEQATDGSGVMLPYIVMEYVEGRTLRDILREGRKILPERALEITASVLSALDYSHRAGIIHRDIKPANVMLTPAGDVKVMDFGIARAIADSSATMTQTAAVVGTAQYLSPEQARGEQVDARSDLYSTGCLLFELLTGRPPFMGDSPVSVAYQHVREEPMAPSTIDQEITPAIDAITLKALAKSVDERYQSATRCATTSSARSRVAPSVAPLVDAAPRRNTSCRRRHTTRRRRPSAGRWARSTRRSLDAGPACGCCWRSWCAALVIAALLVVPHLLSRRSATAGHVPNVQGKTLNQARDALEEDEPRGRGGDAEVLHDRQEEPVMSQSINPDERVEEGTEVDLEYSAGAQTETVPDVSDMSLSQATEALTELGFNVVPEEDPRAPSAATRSPPPTHGREKASRWARGHPGLLLDRVCPRGERRREAEGVATQHSRR